MTKNRSKILQSLKFFLYKTFAGLLNQLRSTGARIDSPKTVDFHKTIYVQKVLKLKLYLIKQSWLRNYKVFCRNSSSSNCLFTFYTFPDTRVLNSFEELYIMRVAAENSFTRVLNSNGGVYRQPYK